MQEAVACGRTGRAAAAVGRYACPGRRVELMLAPCPPRWLEPRLGSAGYTEKDASAPARRDMGCNEKAGAVLAINNEE